MIVGGYLIPIFIQVIFCFILFEYFHFLTQRERFDWKTPAEMNTVCSSCMQYCITACADAVTALNIGKGRKLHPGEKKRKHYHKAVIKHSLVTDVAQFTGAY